MATTTVTIGSNQSISTNTTSGSSGSGPYVITFTSSVDSKVVVGDIFVISDTTSHFATHTYLVTAISGSNYTLKQVDGQNLLYQIQEQPKPSQKLLIRMLLHYFHLELFSDSMGFLLVQMLSFH